MNTLTSFKRKFQYGFTLIELLLVIGIIAILAAIVIVAINPTKQLADARNAQRRSDVNTILNAVYQYAIDNDGNLPSGIPALADDICIDDGLCPDTVNLFQNLSDSYLVGIPTDPQTNSGSTGQSGYQIAQDGTTGRITVNAPYAENSVTISVSR